MRILVLDQGEGMWGPQQALIKSDAPDSAVPTLTRREAWLDEEFMTPVSAALK